jgi:hypothetical protein
MFWNDVRGGTVFYWINPGNKENADSEYGSRQIVYNDEVLHKK